LHTDTEQRLSALKPQISIAGLMSSSPHQLAPSERGRRNIASGDTVGDDDLGGQPDYDPVKSPEGLIAVWGASNDLMVDWLRDYCATYGSHYQLANGTLKLSFPSLYATGGLTYLASTGIRRCDRLSG
jgi:hypothetical protein